MIKKERSEKQKINDEKLKLKLKQSHHDTKERDTNIYKEEEKKIEDKDVISMCDVILPPGPPIRLGRVRSRKIYYPYDIIEDNSKQVLNIIQK